MVATGTDAAAFGKVFDAALPRIYEFFARRVEDRQVAEELTTTTFERALGVFSHDSARVNEAGEGGVRALYGRTQLAYRRLKSVVGLVD